MYRNWVTVISVSWSHLLQLECIGNIRGACYVVFEQYKQHEHFDRKELNPNGCLESVNCKNALS